MQILVFIFGYIKYIAPVITLVEAGNELVVMFLALAYFSCSNHITSDSEWREKIGWVLIITVTLLFIFNVVCMVYYLVKVAIKKTKQTRFFNKKSVPSDNSNPDVVAMTAAVDFSPDSKKVDDSEIVGLTSKAGKKEHDPMMDTEAEALAWMLNDTGFGGRSKQESPQKMSAAASMMILKPKKFKDSDL